MELEGPSTRAWHVDKLSPAFVMAANVKHHAARAWL